MNNLFRGFTAILYKEFIVVFRDRTALFFMFFPPMLQIIAFGFALDLDVKHMPTALLNQDRSLDSRQLVDAFVNTETFRIVKVVDSPEESAATIRRGEAYLGIEIPPNFARELRARHTAYVQVLIDGSSSTSGLQALNTAISVTFNESLKRLIPESGRSGIPIEVRPQVLYNPALRSPNFFVPGVIGTALQLATVFATALSIVRERERGTLEQLLVSPISRWGLMLGKIVPGLVHHHDNGCAALCDFALDLFRPDSWQRRRAFRRGVPIHFHAAQPGFADFNQGANTDGSISVGFGFPFAGHLFLRLYFSAGNDALDFLLDRSMYACDLFYHADAGDRAARGKSRRLLVVSSHPGRDGRRTVCALRGAVQQKDWVVRASRVLCAGR